MFQTNTIYNDFFEHPEKLPVVFDQYPSPLTHIIDATSISKTIDWAHHYLTLDKDNIELLMRLLREKRHIKAPTGSLLEKIRQIAIEWHFGHSEKIIFGLYDVYGYFYGYFYDYDTENIQNILIEYVTKHPKALIRNSGLLHDSYFCFFSGLNTSQREKLHALIIDFLEKNPDFIINLQSLVPSCLEELDTKEKHRLNSLIMDALEKDSGKIYLFIDLFINQKYWNKFPGMTDLDEPLEKRFQALIKKFLDENPNEAPLIDKLHPYYRCVRELNISLKSRLREIETNNQMLGVNGSLSYGVSLSLSSLETNDDIEQTLIHFLKKYHKNLRDFVLELHYSEYTLEDLPKIGLLINRLPLPDGTRLVLGVLNGSYTHTFSSNADKLTCFMGSLNNPCISICDLSPHSNRLGQATPDAFLGFARVLSQQSLRVVLHNNELNLLGLDTLRTFLEILNDGSNLGLDLSKNKLEMFGCDELFELNEKNKSMQLSFFSTGDNDNLTIALQAACAQASLEKKYFWAMFYYRSLMLSELLSLYESLEPKIFSFELTSVQNLKILYFLLERMGPLNNYSSYNHRLFSFLHTILRNNPIRSSDLLLFARKILLLIQTGNASIYTLTSIFYQRTSHYVDNQEIIDNISNIFDRMTPEHRIELFLDIFESDRDSLYQWRIFEYFSVFEADHPSNEILRTLQGIHRNNSQEYLDDDVVRDRLLTMTLPALRPVLEKSIPIEAENLVAFIEKYRTQHAGEDGVLPTTNMIEWLVWACAKLTLYPALCQRPEQGSEAQRQTWELGNTLLKRALSETLQFASPQGRYTLTTALLNHLSDHAKDLELSPYVQINQDAANNTLLVSIPLAQIINPIIASEQDPKKKREMIDQVKTIIALMPLAQCPGRHYRTIVNTLLVLAEDTTLQSLKKLKLIEQVIQRRYFNQADQLISQFEQLIKLLDNTDPEGQVKYSAIWNTIKEKYPDLLLEFEETLGIQKDFRPRAFQSHRVLTKDFNKKFRQAIFIYFKNLKAFCFKMFLSDFILLQGLSNLGKLRDIYGLDDAFEAKCRTIFKTLFDLEDHHFTHYRDTVVDYRNSAGLLTYFSKMQSLSSETGQAVLELFKKFVKVLLSEKHQDFYAMRYAIEDNSHIKPLFDARPDLEAQWKTGACYNFEDFIKDRSIVYKQYQPDLSSLIYKKIFGHKHLDPQYYNHLKDYLDAKNPEEKENAKQKSFDHRTSFSTQSISMQPETDEARHANIQVALIELLEIPLDHDHVSTHHYESALRTLRTIDNMLCGFRPRPQFSHDIKGIIAGLKSNFYPPKNTTFKDWKIIDTDHPWDLLMAGTDVEGSCQAIDGSPKLNQCLMAYVMDPKNRMLAIQDQDGTTIARCILRLLVDDEDQPVLFMEEIYPDNARSDFKTALQHMALQRAKDLGLPLLSLESTPESYAYPSPVHSRYSPAPTEYVDALYGAQEDGEFTIPAPQCLFEPRLQLKEQVQPLSSQTLKTDAELPPTPLQASIIFGWEAWQAHYQTTHPLREAAGYGPGTIIVRP